MESTKSARTDVFSHEARILTASNELQLSEQNDRTLTFQYLKPYLSPCGLPPSICQWPQISRGDSVATTKLAHSDKSVEEQSEYETDFSERKPEFRLSEKLIISNEEGASAW